MYKKISYSALILFSIMLAVAGNHQFKSQRESLQQPNYNDFLSDAYKRVTNYEKLYGSYENISYFNKRAKTVLHSYNPRPLMTKKYVNNVKNRRELRLARFELERFINGYAQRVAPKDVAMMHAAFDCRVRNIETNSKLNKNCKSMFLKHKNLASKAVTNYLKPKVIFERQENHIPHTPKPNTTKQEIIPNSKKLPQIEPKSKPQDIKINKNKKMMLPVADKKNSQKQNSQKDIQYKALPKLKNIPNNAAKVQNSPTPKTRKNTEELPKKTKFNPLNYIHPTLLKRSTKAQEPFKPAAPTAINKPTVSINKPALSNNEPAIKKKEISTQKPLSFGIKPTSNIKLPPKSIGSQAKPKFKTIRQYFEENISKQDIKKQSQFKPQSIMSYKPQQFSNNLTTNSTIKYDPISTSSIQPSGGLKRPIRIQINFSNANNISNNGLKNLSKIAYLIKDKKNMHITIIGHADQGKFASIDHKMSYKRAYKIKNILSKYNKDSKMNIQALGSNRPLRGLSKLNDLNRRVEVIIQ